MVSGGSASLPAGEVSGLILAGGTGARAGMGPKAFVEIAGRPLLRHVVDLLAPFAGELIAGVPPAHLERARSFLADLPVHCVAAGTDRQATVGIVARHATRPYVIVQDVARPLTPAAHIEAALAMAREHGAVVTSIRATRRDGVALADGDVYGESLPRERVIRTQTPQVYRREILLEALDQADAGGWQEISPAALVTRAGHPVRLLACAVDNLKITYPEDVAEANLVLARRRSASVVSGS